MVRDPALTAFGMVSIGDIARAYEMYLKRGRTEGFDGEDWHRAEKELKEPPSSSCTSDRQDGRGTNAALNIIKPPWRSKLKTGVVRRLRSPTRRNHADRTRIPEDDGLHCQGDQDEQQ